MQHASLPSREHSRVAPETVLAGIPKWSAIIVNFMGCMSEIRDGHGDSGQLLTGLHNDSRRLSFQNVLMLLCF
jgi:hypothetical protein